MIINGVERGKACQKKGNRGMILFYFGRHTTTYFNHSTTGVNEDAGKNHNVCLLIPRRLNDTGSGGVSNKFLKELTSSIFPISTGNFERIKI